MNTRLLVLGVNIIVVSALLAVYGILVGNSGLVGIALSVGILGGILVVYSTTPQDPSVVALASYSEILVNAVTSTLEDLDLLESRICAVKRDNYTYLVYSKTTCPLGVDPGVGFTGGSPYLAIPASTPSVLVESSSEPTSSTTLLERSLTEILVGEFSACRGVRVEEEGGFYRVHIMGLTGLLKQYLERPVDPFTLFVLVVSSEILRAGCVKLIEKKITPDGVLIVLRSEKSGAEG